MCITEAYTLKFVVSAAAQVRRRPAQQAAQVRRRPQLQELRPEDSTPRRCRRGPAPRRQHARRLRSRRSGQGQVRSSMHAWVFTHKSFRGSHNFHVAAAEGHEMRSLWHNDNGCRWGNTPWVFTMTGQDSRARYAVIKLMLCMIRKSSSGVHV
jgi:hypothetical protein